jgi:hypothetical protein
MTDLDDRAVDSSRCGILEWTGKKGNIDRDLMDPAARLQRMTSQPQTGWRFIVLATTATCN